MGVSFPYPARLGTAPCGAPAGRETSPPPPGVGGALGPKESPPPHPLHAAAAGDSCFCGSGSALRASAGLGPAGHASEEPMLITFGEGKHNRETDGKGAEWMNPLLESSDGVVRAQRWFSWGPKILRIRDGCSDPSFFDAPAQSH